MPELIEQMYCSQQIVIPPKFPYILKRYCKAAIKTQPYDLLRWSFEYFKALAERRPPPVKLRLEYPVYSTEGGLTRGCLKVLANQMLGMKDVPVPVLKSAWRGFCLDPNELTRVICLCEAHLRRQSIPFLKFIAVAGGLLTKNLTHTMILLCETLTKEPDGGSAAIPVDDFLEMYSFLARMRAEKNVRYINGYREGDTPSVEPVSEVEEEESVTSLESIGSDDFWLGAQALKKITVIDASITTEARLSIKMNQSVLGKIQRSPSAERAAQIERENYMRERKGRAKPDEEVEEKLRDMSDATVGPRPEKPAEAEAKAKDKGEKTKKKDGIDITVVNEEGIPIPYEFYGEPDYALDEFGEEGILELEEEEEEHKEEKLDEKEHVKNLIAHLHREQSRRRKDLEETFDDITRLVDRFNSANYDLGVVAGRQMSITSGEFIVQNIEREIMEYIDEQIAILPDPDLKKKKAKPEEVEMVRELLEEMVDESFNMLAAEAEGAEEEEEGAIPDIVTVYAVPGIGPPVPEDIIADFEDYATEVCRVQADMFMPRNIRHFLCPPLEKYEEYKYDDKKEELPTEGALTD